MTRVQQLLSEFRKGWEPPKQLSVHEWADLNFKLSPEYAAEAGDWSTLSFQREPLDTISDPTVWQTVIKSCTQLLKTTVIQIGTAYVIDQDPGPILIVQPRDDDAKAFSKERIAPMLRDVPCLRGKVSDSKAKTSANTIEEKWFRGGLLACTAAGSPGNLARRAIRFLFCDEEDKWVVSSGAEGKPFNLALKRTATFRHRKKAIRCCSPTRSGSSIDKAYEESDQRQYYVRCPHCGHEQSMMLKFRTQVRFSDDPTLTKEQRAKTARYHCEACDVGWTDAERHAAVEAGRWVAHAPFSGVAGFWISELYSPWKQLWEIVLDWLKAQGDNEAMVAFVNTSLAENWTEPGEQVDWERLVERREDYPVGSLPAGALILTAGVDVHPDRVEVEILGSGRNRETWSIDYQVHEGKVTPESLRRVLEGLLAETFQAKSGVDTVVERIFVDSGNDSNTVYQAVHQLPVARISAIKGYQKRSDPVGQPSPQDVTIGGRKIKHGLTIRPIWVDFFKGQLYSDLKGRPPTEEERAQGWGYPAGYCHFPKGPYYGDEHFKQLCAEREVTRKNKQGRTVREWEQTRARNEALDCRVYAMAAAWDCGVGTRFQEMHWKKREERRGVTAPLPSPVATEPVPQQTEAQPAAVAPRPPQIRPRRIIRSRYLS